MKSVFNFCITKQYPVPYSVQPHTHPCFELVYYASGSGTVVIDERQYSFSKGTLVLAPPNVIHSETAPEPVTAICIGFDSSDRELGGSISARFTDDGEHGMLNLIEAIVSETKNKLLYHRQILDALTEALAFRLMRFITAATEAASDFEYVLGYIQMHANEKTNVREIARDLSYNYDYFRHFFLKKTGVNAKEYLLGIKIGNARQYLETTDYSIKKIAQITGFATPSHFCERFTRVVGETPQQYRRNVQKPDFSDMHYTPVVTDPSSDSDV